MPAGTRKRTRGSRGWLAAGSFGQHSVKFEDQQVVVEARASLVPIEQLRDRSDLVSRACWRRAATAAHAGSKRNEMV
jgi:hypothetical protein